MKYVPHAFQSYDTQKIIDLPAVALWLEMGLGKSVITLTAIQRLKYDMLAVCKVLVIAPKKVAEATWQAEVAKWDHLSQLRTSTVLGSTKQRIRALAAPADVYIINRDNVAWLVDYYQQNWPFDMVVLDESSSFKSARSKRWRKLKAVKPHIKRVVELTGTPSPQGLTDLWAQIFLLDDGRRLGRTLGSFRERWFLPDKRNATTIFTYKPRGGAEQEIRELLSDICISMKAEDYLSLPALITDDVPVILDTAAAKAYAELERDALLQVDPESIVFAGTAAVLTNKLLQLCNGAIYDERHDTHEVHRCKIEAFLELVEQLHGEHALVAYNYQHDRDRLLAALEGSGLRIRVFSDAEDAAAWNRGEVDILLAHPASCAYGLNLQAGGHHVIWFGLNWGLELTEQFNARLHRQGQPEPVIVHRLIVTSGMDADVVSALESKGDVQNRLLDSLKARIDKVKEGDINDGHKKLHD